MKTFKNIISGIVWTLLGTYLVLVALLHIPAVQTFVASETGKTLEKKFGTRFDIGRVNLGFLNRVIIDDVVMYDRHGKAMLQASRLSAKIDIYPLSAGEISVSSAQIFGFQGCFYRQNENTPANYQFALDSLASKDTVTHQSPNLHIGSLIIRNGGFHYDRHDIAPTKGRFNIGHINVYDISAHVILPYFNDNGIQIQLKKLSLKEISGLHLNNLSFKLTADSNNISINNLCLKLPSTNINASKICAKYEYENRHIKPGTLQFEGGIEESEITLSDIACLIPAFKSFVTPLSISTHIAGTDGKINIKDINVNSKDNRIALSANGHIYDWQEQPEWNMSVTNLKANAGTIELLSKNIKGKDINAPEILTRLGDVSFKGSAGGKYKTIFLAGNLDTGIGHTKIDAGLQGKTFRGHIITDGIDIRQLLSDDRFGIIATDININGNMENKDAPVVNAKGKILKFDYNSYSYNNIEIDGKYQNNIFDGSVAMEDPNGSLNINGRFDISSGTPSARLTAAIRNLNPGALNISRKWGDAIFNADITADISGKKMNELNGYIDLTDFSMVSADKDYHLDNMHIAAGYKKGKHAISMNSDFGYAEITGTYDYSTITRSLANLIGSRLPTLPGLPRLNSSGNNNFTINVSVSTSEWLKVFCDIPLSLNAPFRMKGSIDDRNRQIDLKVQMPDFTYNESRYENAGIEITTNNGTIPAENKPLHAKGHVRKVMDNGHKMDITINTRAADNRMEASISWDNKQKHPMKGIFNSTMEFFKTEKGESAAHIHVAPSEILVNDTAWNVLPSDIMYSKKRLEVDAFTIRHNKQHIIISGLATESLNDSMTVDMQDIDVSYILNLVNFHSVEFSGLASGKACIKSAFKNPDAHSKLTVRKFKFQDGRMGLLTAGVKWNQTDKQIDIDAYTNDGPGSSTIIKGYVSPARNCIDLRIKARNTRLEFLESFCGSFMANVDAHANGELRLAGDLSNINLTGEMVADGKIDISTLNTTYWLKNDTIRLIPDEIIFNNNSIYDKYGNKGIVNGMLHHKHLTRLTFDLNVSAQNLLSYNFSDYDGNSFYGTVYATGNCAIRGRRGRIDFDINATPEKGSFIEYNAASPDAITNQEFIEWHEKRTDTATGNIHADTLLYNEEAQQQNDDIPTDIHLNFIINTNPDFTLRVLMDQQSGDNIALNGNGTLRASYYNKGTFDMFGNYMIDHGTYKLTIQNIIKKEFTFQSGSTIVFGGDPYNAALNLKAQYTVNGVPLSDLQIGKSFSSNNVRVDCMMNITGTPQSPRVDFDLDLPTVNADAKQMVRSLINSEEEMNQQVIYLLSIGRFYTPNTNNSAEDNNQQSQTSLAMQSLLSGTLSQQINEVLSTLVNSNNWNFGANISTGDEGWNNAEYEGMLSGRLMNNRLLINGQFGYRDNENATTSFIGDFDIRYLLFPNGNLAIKMYNQTNDRYFTKSSLNTQGIGLIMKKDFNSWKELFIKRSRKKKVETDKK